MRVLRYIRHHHVPCPFICIECAPGVAEIIWPKPRSKKAVKLYIDKRDHGGRHEYPPEEWSDELCVIMAKRALGVKDKKHRRK